MYTPLWKPYTQTPVHPVCITVHRHLLLYLLFSPVMLWRNTNTFLYFPANWLKKVVLSVVCITHYLVHIQIVHIEIFFAHDSLSSHLPSYRSPKNQCQLHQAWPVHLCWREVLHLRGVAVWWRCRLPGQVRRGQLLQVGLQGAVLHVYIWLTRVIQHNTCTCIKAQP